MGHSLILVLHLKWADRAEDAGENWGCWDLGYIPEEKFRVGGESLEPDASGWKKNWILVPQLIGFK